MIQSSLLVPSMMRVLPLSTAAVGTSRPSRGSTDRCERRGFPALCILAEPPGPLSTVADEVDETRGHIGFARETVNKKTDETGQSKCLTDGTTKWVGCTGCR